MSETLRRERLAAGLSLRELARRAKVGRNHITKVERGESYLFDGPLERLIAVLEPDEPPSAMQVMYGERPEPVTAESVCPRCGSIAIVRNAIGVWCQSCHAQSSVQPPAVPPAQSGHDRYIYDAAGAIVGLKPDARGCVSAEDIAVLLRAQQRQLQRDGWHWYLPRW